MTVTRSWVVRRVAVRRDLVGRRRRRDHEVVRADVLRDVVLRALRLAHGACPSTPRGTASASRSAPTTRAATARAARSTGRGTGHAAAGRDRLLDELERGEGLARAAGHDELAAVVLGEARDDVVDGLALVLADPVALLALELRRPLCRCGAAPTRRGRPRVPGARCGRRRSAGRSARPRRCSTTCPWCEMIRREVNGALPEAVKNESMSDFWRRVRGLEELALDGADATVALDRDEVDAGVLLVRRVRPVGVRHDRGEARGVDRVRLEVADHNSSNKVPLSRIPVAWARRSASTSSSVIGVPTLISIVARPLRSDTTCTGFTSRDRTDQSRVRDFTLHDQPAPSNLAT